MPERVITFGLELEFVEKSPVYAENCHGFAEREDTSVKKQDGTMGYELVTPPLTCKVTNNDGAKPRVTYDASVVKRLCDCARAVNDTCGLHVHVGRPTSPISRSHWSADQCHAWLVTGMALESKLYAACPASRQSSKHAKPIRDIYPPAKFTSSLVAHPAHPAMPNKYENPLRYCWLNLVETVRPSQNEMPFERQNHRGLAAALGTVEIRMMGNTRRFSYVDAWLRLCLTWGAVMAYTDPVRAISGITLGDWLSDEIEAVMAAKNSAVRSTATSRQSPIERINERINEQTHGLTAEQITRLRRLARRDNSMPADSMPADDHVDAMRMPRIWTSSNANSIL